MATSSTYFAVRDDKTFRSLSLNERDFLREGAHSSPILRLDGRRGNEMRKVRIKLGRWDNGAECTVQWGAGTRVTSLCTAELIPPSLDRPNEGMVNFTVDLSPMAGTCFRLAPPVGTAPSGGGTNTKGPNFSDKNQRLLSNRILRSVERIVLLGGALDTEALVLIPGSWVWRITVALTVLDDGGNVIDACILAAMATLRHYRKPQVHLENDGALPTLIPSTLKEASPLPLHHTPVSISFALLPSKDNISSESSVTTLIDPEKREELVQFGTVSIAMNTHLEVCLLDYGGGHELTPEQLKECFTTASAAVKHLCQELETALKEADEMAQKEMLLLLQLKENSGMSLANVLLLTEEGTTDARYMPYLQTSDMVDAAGAVSVVESSTMELNNAVETEAEELYRQQALDYSRGHFATSVREDEVETQRVVRKDHGSSLFTSLLKAATGTAAVEKSPLNSTSEKTAEHSVDAEMSDSHPRDASLEQEQTVEMEKNIRSGGTMESSAAKKPSYLSSSDDEESTTLLLPVEYAGVPAGNTVKDSGEATVNSVEPTTIDDLSMAVKKKKDKGKSKKKK